MEITDEQFEAISTFGFNTNWRYVDGEFVLESLMDDDSLRKEGKENVLILLIIDLNFGGTN